MKDGYLTFQFQYGAIGSVKDRIVPMGLSGSFNSSMVRLGGIIEYHRSGYAISFNSSMVRLGAILVLNSLKKKEFQFQYGAIGSLLNTLIIRTLKWFQFQYGAIGSVLLTRVFSVRNFVSIPVWCDWEQARDLTDDLVLRSFNSSMVRLGDRCKRVALRSSSSFNSSMVRLGEKKPGRRLFAFSFQFQYGAIGSIIPAFDISSISRFQFQYGAIGR